VGDLEVLLEDGDDLVEYTGLLMVLAQVARCTR
jgi:hypothetical protein